MTLRGMARITTVRRRRPGGRALLRAVWRAYHIYVQIQAGQIDHTPALYVIDQRGREREIYLTTMAYASVGQEGQVLAQEVASLLPGHPKLARQSSLAYINGISPASRTTLTAVPSGSVTLGPGQPRLVMFFATWRRRCGLRRCITPSRGCSGPTGRNCACTPTAADS
jgi:hypothetical protein